MLPERDILYLADRGLAYEVSSDQGMTCVVVKDWPLPAGLSPGRSTCCSGLRPAIPISRRTCGGSARTSRATAARPIQATQVTEGYLGRTWQRWSRHLPAGVWRSGVDGLESFFAVIRADVAACVAGSARMSVATLVLPLRLRDELRGRRRSQRRDWLRAAGQRGRARRAGAAAGSRAAPGPGPGYLSRGTDGMTVTPAGYLAALARAEDIGAAALWVHTHPGAGSSPCAERQGRRRGPPTGRHLPDPYRPALVRRSGVRARSGRSLGLSAGTCSETTVTRFRSAAFGP